MAQAPIILYLGIFFEYVGEIPTESIRKSSGLLFP
jgi:hypothetical protein